MRKTDLDVTVMELGGAIGQLHRLHDRLVAAGPVEPRMISEEHKALGYRVAVIDGTHDGFGNAYVSISLNGVPVLGSEARVSAGDSVFIRGFITGHAKATTEWKVVVS